MRSPKQAASYGDRYKYYAGYTESFVNDVLARFAKPEQRILDPWNGSGTTTAVAAERGMRSIGVDINPAVLPLAWARLARPDLVAALFARAGSPAPKQTTAHNPEADPLLQYFVSDTSAALRNLQGKLLHDASCIVGLNTVARDQELMALTGAAFVLFSNLIRLALRPFRSTNPSWFSKPKNARDRIKLGTAELDALLSHSLHVLRKSTFFQRQRQHIPHWPALLIDDSGRNLGHLGQFDMVLSSPPYCTRLDYAVATVPELLALGVPTQEIQRLRSRITGCAVTDPNADKITIDGGALLVNTLSRIKRHHTKAAASYYSRYFTLYFANLLAVLKQVPAGLSPHGIVILVTQNSFFKDFEIDLRGIILEEMMRHGLQLEASWENSARLSLAGTNARYKHYRDVNVRREDVIVMRKEK